MFEGDVYLVLIEGGDWAVAALSGVLVFLAVAAVRVARRHVNLPAAIPTLGLMFWWTFLWLTPQVYYLLYMALLDTLEFRWVIGWPPGPDRLLELLIFRAGPTQTDAALGALGWMMCLLAFPRG